MQAIVKPLVSGLTWIKKTASAINSVGRLTHIKFKPTANDQLDWLIAGFARAAAAIVTTVTGLATFVMAKGKLEEFNAHWLFAVAIALLLSALMWWLTDRTLGFFVEKVSFDLLYMLYPAFWNDLLKRKGLAKRRYALTSRFIHLAIGLGIVWLIKSSIDIDQAGIEVVKDSVAKSLVRDTTRNLSAEQAPIYAQSNPEIERLTAEKLAIEKAMSKKESWKVALNGFNSKHRKLVEEGNGWAEGLVEDARKKYVKGLRGDLDEIKAQLKVVRAVRDSSLATIEADVSGFNETNRERSTSQYLFVTGMLLTLGVSVKKLFCGAIFMRVAVYMAETNGGVDLNGDGQADQADIAVWAEKGETQPANF